MIQYAAGLTATFSLSGGTTPVTPCSLASTASSPTTGVELNRPHPSAVPAPVLTETKWRQVPRGTSWEATALWVQEERRTTRKEEDRPLLCPSLSSLHFLFSATQPVPCPAHRRAEDFTSTPPIQATQHHTVHPPRCCVVFFLPQQQHGHWLSLRMFVRPADRLL